MHVLHLLLVEKYFWVHSLCQLNHYWHERWWRSLYCTGGQWEWLQLLLGHWAAGRTRYLPQDGRSQWWCWSTLEQGLNWSTAMLPWHLRYLWPELWPQWEWEELRSYKAQSKTFAKLQAELQEHGTVFWNIWVISTIFWSSHDQLHACCVCYIS